MIKNTLNSLQDSMDSIDYLNVENAMVQIEQLKNTKKGLSIKRGKTDFNNWIKRDQLTEQIQSLNCQIESLGIQIDSILNKYYSL
jgi:hypothetical protein